MSRYVGDPKVIDHWPHPRFRANNGKLHRHRANNVKSQLWSHIAFHGSIPLFHVLLLLATQWLVRARSSCWGGAVWRPCNFTPTHSLTGPVGEQFASCLGVSVSRPGMHKLTMEWVSPVGAVLTAVSLPACPRHLYISSSLFPLWVSLCYPFHSLCYSTIIILRCSAFSLYALPICLFKYHQCPTLIFYCPLPPKNTEIPDRSV
jgi:hypothetical protein